MPPENLMQFLQELMTPAAPVSTGTAHDEINRNLRGNIIQEEEHKEYKKGES